MSAPLLKETHAHATRWLRWQLGDGSDRPMPWELFADGLERQRDCARDVAEQYISKANAYDAEVLGYRETIKALEERVKEYDETINSLREIIRDKNIIIRMAENKLAQVENQLANKDGYPAEDCEIVTEIDIIIRGRKGGA